MFLRYLLWLVLLWGFVSQQFLVAKTTTFYTSQTSEYNSETQFDFEKVYADVQVINGFKVIPALALDYLQHKNENKKLTALVKITPYDEFWFLSKALSLAGKSSRFLRVADFKKSVEARQIKKLDISLNEVEFKQLRIESELKQIDLTTFVDYSMVNGARNVSQALRNKILAKLSSTQADNLFAELATNPTLKAAMEADEILPQI